ncbi:hypothetical protein QA601_10005 [Chitinispirillales bacterium ANBcel5]|uniref:hypothetical protein n=1 Tax=Cellulosispirillum alkaliphilum TaxID=3039283 RepID=UPI002A5472CD|nr:hypothetical protein [Chitinispirillales bacterium ANBcel5]
MNTSREIDKEIEEEMAALISKEFRRPSMRIDEFLDEYSALLQQAKKDKTELVAAQFDWSLMPKYDRYLALLFLAAAETVNAELAMPEIKKEYDERLETLLFNLSVLREVAMHIVSNPKNDDVINSYNRIIENRGKANAATTVVDLVAFIRDYPTEAAQICPAGIRVDECYLDEVKQRALTLIKMKGSVVIGAKEVSAVYSRKKRLLTLSMRATAHIKKYARIAFVKNRKYYVDNYVSKVRRRQSIRYSQNKTVTNVP